MMALVRYNFILARGGFSRAYSQNMRRKKLEFKEIKRKFKKSSLKERKNLEICAESFCKKTTTGEVTGWVLVYLLLPIFFDSVLLESQSRDDDF